MSVLQISQPDYEALRASGEEAYPSGCCGVLLGKSEPGMGTACR
jgi:hypothetical protein